MEIIANYLDQVWDRLIEVVDLLISLTLGSIYFLWCLLDLVVYIVLTITLPLWVLPYWYFRKRGKNATRTLSTKWQKT